MVEQEIHIMDAQQTNRQQLHQAATWLYTETSEEYFQHPIKYMPKAKAKSGQNWQDQVVPNWGYVAS